MSMNTGQRFLRLIAVWLTVALAGSSAIAQTTTGGTGSSAARAFPSTPSNFGPGESVLSIGAVSFVVLDSFQGYANNLDGSKFATGTSARLGAAMNLPTGAVIDVFEFEVYDNDPSNTIEVNAFVCSGNPAGTPCTSLGLTFVSGTPGWTYAAIFPSPSPTTIDNNFNQYFVQVALPGDGGITMLRRVEVFYHLQVSPAPLTATFTDVPTSDFGFQFIEAFNAAGITVGCNSSPPMFCPDRNVTRREMAVFFAKALGLYFPF
jgi:hypothetical protein